DVLFFQFRLTVNHNICSFCLTLFYKIHFTITTYLYLLTPTFPCPENRAYQGARPSTYRKSLAPHMNTKGRGCQPRISLQSSCWHPLPFRSRSFINYFPIEHSPDHLYVRYFQRRRIKYIPVNDDRVC